jgi:hypothetical protein
MWIVPGANMDGTACSRIRYLLLGGCFGLFVSSFGMAQFVWTVSSTLTVGFHSSVPGIKISG